MAEAEPTALRFAGFTLDPAARTLVDASGCEVALRRSEYELLRALLGPLAASVRKFTVRT